MQVWQLIRGLCKYQGTSPEFVGCGEDAAELLLKWLEVGRVVRNWVNVAVGEKLGELVDER